MQDFQSFRSQLTPLTYLPVGDEVIAALMCVDANHELIEAPYSTLPLFFLPRQLNKVLHALTVDGTWHQLFSDHECRRAIDAQALCPDAAALQLLLHLG